MDTYHSGEREAQRRAGVRDLAERVGRIIDPTIPAAAATFLAQRTFVITATTSADGGVHASILSGSAGFAAALDPSTIRLRPTAGDRETVIRDLRESAAIGLLAIDFATRRRMRANGTAIANGQDLLVTTREVYSNCPQYIHPRAELTLHDGASTRTDQLTESQMTFIAAADTFFIASSHPERGADVSHRGGEPGFVSVTPASVSWLDYPGNNMFNTLGNLLIHEGCSLLFVDFPSGNVLRIDGRASIEWAQSRRIEVAIDAVMAFAT
jgi:predicted pyridoxine 5'-phosphate oxidase superfamily flavin-nucleotide-binding protein